MRCLPGRRMSTSMLWCCLCEHLPGILELTVLLSLGNLLSCTASSESYSKALHAKSNTCCGDCWMRVAVLQTSVPLAKVSSYNRHA